VQAFKQGKSSLNDIELKLLGNVKGLSILHLQCHFGQDSLSLARMGARVCGVDLSDKAIDAAKNLAAETGLKAEFICCNVYDLPLHLDKQFDIVFTSYGTIGWLPDLDRWAGVIERFLKPGGRFVFAEFHPVVWMFDNDFDRVAYRYFRSEAIVETENGSYADRSSETVNQSVTWNHGLGEVIGSLLAQGLQISSFEEYDHSPYNCFNGTVEFAPGRFRIEKLGDKIPMVYALSAVKPL
jgi:ubiquinone/menaquinone biosynthesis C-methylase UbiE